MKRILLACALFSFLFLVGCSKNQIPTNNDLDLYGLYEESETVKLNAKAASNINIAQKYIYEEELVIPDFAFTHEGNTYNAQAYLKFPSGKVTDNKRVTLNEDGQYELVYLAKCGDIILEQTYNFIVTAELYSIIGDKSTVYYGQHEYIPNTNGLVASIKPTEYFVYNKPIDLSTYNQKDKIISFTVTPSTIGVADANKIIFKLVDIYDENNFITVELKKYDAAKEGWAENTTYLVAYGNGQDACGLEKGSHPGNGRVVEYAGEAYTVHQNNQFGAGIRYSLPGAPRFDSITNANYKPEYVGEQKMSISMDYEKGQLYVSTNSASGIINDLRSDIVYGSNFWTGFTTGEVYLSISATNYNSDSMNLLIYDIGGESTADMLRNEYVDNVVPTLDVLWDIDYPIGLVGNKYPIFESKAFDNYDHDYVDVEASVYLNYGLSNEVMVPVVDNCFYPSIKGEYYIVYRAVDKSGNVNEKVVTVFVSDDVDSIDIANASEAETNFEVGNEASLKKLEYKNNIGDIKEKVTAVLKSDSSVQYDITGYKFIPLYAGEYDIVYEYSDFMFDGKYSYVINVEHTDVPAILDKITLSEYFIKGCQYNLPIHTGFVFENGKPVEKTIDIYVTEGTNTTKLENGVYNPNYDGEITISYVLANGSVESRIDFRAVAVDSGYDTVLEMGKYFYSDNVTIQPEGNYIQYNITDRKNTTLEFINTISAEQFSIKLSACEGKDNFSKINIYLTDVNNENIKLKFTYEKTSSGTIRFYTNDGGATEYGTLFASIDNPITCEFNNKILQVSPEPNKFQYVTHTLGGEEFTGFTSDRVYLFIEIENVTGDSALNITNLCGQTFSKIKADIIEPKVYVNHDVGDHNINSTYTLSKAIIFDVLDPMVEAYVSVKAPDDSFVTTKDGILLEKSALYNVEHEIVLEQFGIYQVHYEAIDTNGNLTRYSYVVNVVDRELPVVKIISPVTSAKVGDTVKIATLHITDNYSEEFIIHASLVAPDAQIHSLSKLNDDEAVIYDSFVAKEQGTYKVCYLVTDQAGNSVFVSYVINVE